MQNPIYLYLAGSSIYFPAFDYISPGRGDLHLPICDIVRILPFN
jgi:hypothetical protein